MVTGSDVTDSAKYGIWHCLIWQYETLKTVNELLLCTSIVFEYIDIYSLVFEDIMVKNRPRDPASWFFDSNGEA